MALNLNTNTSIMTPSGRPRLSHDRPSKDPDAVHANDLSTRSCLEPMGRHGMSNSNSNSNSSSNISSSSSESQKKKPLEGSPITTTTTTTTTNNNNHTRLGGGRSSLRRLALLMLTLVGISVTLATETLSSFLQGMAVEDKTRSTTKASKGLGKDQEDAAHTTATTTYTIVVIRCTNNVEWLREVPSDWRIVVYDKCGKDTAQEFPWLRANHTTVAHYKALNVGAEECNGYLDYMYDHYYNLTDVTVFVHDDALRPYDNKHEGNWTHTPFDTFEPLVNVTKQYLTREHPFLHYGVLEIPEVWGLHNYHGKAMKILWPYFALPYSSNNKDESNVLEDTTMIGNTTTTNTSSPQAPVANLKRMKLEDPPLGLTFKPSAHFAVRKEQILMRPRATYMSLLQQLQQSDQIPGYSSPRQMCCALERTWHIFFGEPAILPKRAMASDLLNITHCIYCDPVARQELAWWKKWGPDGWWMKEQKEHK